MVHEKVIVSPFDCVGSDERGTTHSFSIRETSNFISIRRKKGTLSGNTYHLGKSSMTNPKIFVLLLGEIIFRYRHISWDKHIELEVTKPSQIHVFPEVTHSIEALEDILLLECNSISDIQNDRTREEVVILG
jgi:hypothetical protein